MSLFDELLPADFRGVPFLFDESEVTSGRKTVVHEFVNSNRRFVEDLGLLNKTFSVRGIIGGNTYIADRDSLIRALETPGPGLLTHPVFGVLNVVAEPYTLSEVQSELGRAIFDMEFSIAQDPILPQALISSAATVSNQASGLYQAIPDQFSTIYVGGNTPANYQSVLQRLNAVVAVYVKTSSGFTGDPDFINPFFTGLSLFNENKLSLINNSSELARQLVNLAISLDNLANTPQQRFNFGKSLFDFGDADVVINPVTQELIDRLANQDAVNDTVQLTGLVNCYRATPLLDFLTIDDVNDTRKILDDKYNDIVNDDGSTQTTKNQLAVIRTDVRKFLDEESKNVFRTTDVTTTQVPATVLTYQYYGSTELLDQIIELNQIDNPVFVQGDIMLLTK